MNLLDLPEEVIGEILKRLDTDSKLLLWKMCRNLASHSHIRNLLQRQSVMQRVHLAGPSSVIQQRALLDLAPHILDLDLSGLRHLMFPTVLRVIRHFTNLRELDLTHTSVGMLKACELCELCPTLKRLAVFFDWPDVIRSRTSPDDWPLHQVQRCQRAFSHLEGVRFLGDCCGMVQCTHPLEILRLNNCVRSLRLDLIEDKNTLYQHFECSARVPPSLRTFDMRYMDSKLKDDNLLLHRIVRFFDLESWHYLMVEKAFTPLFHMSQSLYAFSEQFLGNTRCNMIAPAAQIESSHLYMWHSDLEIRNPQLLQQITERIRASAPILTCGMNDTVNILSKSFVVHVYSLPPVLEPPTKRYFTEQIIYLNLDRSLQMTRDARVTVVSETCRECSSARNFSMNLVLRLDPSSATVRNLSYLCIVDCWIDASFKALWEICRNLQTVKLINAEIISTSGFHNAMQTVHLSSSIKNLMYVDVDVDLRRMIRSMAHCPSLENVYWGNMEDKSSRNVMEPDFNDFSRLIYCCRNLRSFSLNLENMNNFESKLRRAVQKHMRNVLIVAQSRYPYYKMERNDPYYAVFEHFDADNVFDDMNFNF